MFSCNHLKKKNLRLPPLKPFSSGRNFFNGPRKTTPKVDHLNPLDVLDSQYEITYEELNKTIDDESKLKPDYYIDKPVKIRKKMLKRS